MNTQEREQLTRFLQQLAQAQVGAKDAEAERLIQEICSRQPDAYYLLVQRSLLLEQALSNAQGEITRLQNNQAANSNNGGSFLNSNNWGNTPAPTQAAQRPANFTPAPQAPAAAANSPGWASGMLGTVATTAAGVVAGSFLFQGIENMMGHHGNSSGLLSGNNPAPTPKAPAENLVAQHADDSGSANNDLDNLGPDDDDPDWA